MLTRGGSVSIENREGTSSEEEVGGGWGAHRRLSAREGSKYPIQRKNITCIFYFCRIN